MLAGQAGDDTALVSAIGRIADDNGVCRRTELCRRVHAERTAGQCGEPVLLVECPRIRFPFARNMLSDVTRNGGFPAVLLQPIDFVALWQSRRKQAGVVRSLPDCCCAVGRESREFGLRRLFMVGR